MKIIKISAAKALHDAATGKKIDMQLISAAKSLITATSTYASIDESVTGEDWEIMIREIKEKEGKDLIDPRTLDALNQVKPTEVRAIEAKLDVSKLSKEELAEYRTMYEDSLKKIEDRQKNRTANIVESEGDD